MHIVPKLGKDFQVNTQVAIAHCIYNKKFGPEKLNLSLSFSNGRWLRIGTLKDLSEVTQQVSSLLKNKNLDFFIVIGGGVIITLLLLFQF